jgi:uncharacterized delta-60 repeat protein
MRQWIEGLESRQLMASGTVDTSFGDGGSTTTRVAVDLSDRERAAAPTQIAVDAGGRTTVLFRTTRSISLYRLTESGQRDSAFAAATGGTLRIGLPTSFGGPLNDVRIAQDANNRTYVLMGPQVIRLTSSGKIDRTYGTRGNATLYKSPGLAGARDIAVQADGSAYVVGTVRRTGDVHRVAVAKLLPSGALDARFGGAGTIVGRQVGTPDSNGDAYGSDVRVLNDGSIMAVGEVAVRFPVGSPITDVTGATALKFNARGVLDAAYGRSGRSTFTVATDATRFRNAAPVSIRGDGAILHDSNDLPLGDQGGPGASENYLTAANGRSNAIIDVTPGTGGNIRQGEFVLDRNVFPGDAAAGSELLLNRNDRRITRYVKSSASYTLDTTFNGGAPIGGAQAVATTAGGAIVYANTDRLTRLTVGRVFATEAPSVQASIPPLTKPAADAVVSVRLRDDDGVIFDQTDGVPTGAVLNGPAGPIPGRLVLGTNAELRFAFAGLGGTWDRSENGAYTVDINFNDLVRGVSGAGDAGGEENFIGTKRVGKLIVAIA